MLQEHGLSPGLALGLQDGPVAGVLGQAHARAGEHRVRCNRNVVVRQAWEYSVFISSSSVENTTFPRGLKRFFSWEISRDSTSVVTIVHWGEGTVSFVLCFDKGRKGIQNLEDVEKCK